MEQRKEALDEKDRVLEMVVPKIMEHVEQSFNERQKLPFQYVVAYYLTKGDTLLGYHSSSFCQLTQKKENGKRYEGEDATSQLKIIRKNLDFTLDRTAEDTGFAALNYSVKEKYFKDLKKEDVWIQAEYLDEGIAPQKFKWEII